MYPFASLPENLAAFCEALRREHRFRIGPRELQDAARALEIVDLADEQAVRNTLRPVLAARSRTPASSIARLRRFFPGPAGAPQRGLETPRREFSPESPARKLDESSEPRAAPTETSHVEGLTGTGAATWPVPALDPAKELGHQAAPTIAPWKWKPRVAHLN